MKIKIPTEAELHDRLAGIERLLTAKGWERAAIVWAFTRNDDQGGRPRNHLTSEVVFPASIAQFARMGFNGLKSEQTVAYYRQAWQTAMDTRIAGKVMPGDPQAQVS